MVLASWSAVLKAQLCRWSPADAARAMVRVVLAPGDSAADCMQLLRFMYTGGCSLTPANALPLLRLSNYYEVTPLKEVRARSVQGPVRLQGIGYRFRAGASSGSTASRQAELSTQGSIQAAKAMSPGD